MHRDSQSMESTLWMTKAGDPKRRTVFVMRADGGVLTSILKKFEFKILLSLAQLCGYRRTIEKGSRLARSKVLPSERAPKYRRTVHLHIH